MSLSTLKPAQTLAQYVGFVPVSDRFSEKLKSLFLDQLEGTKDIACLDDRVAGPIYEAIEGFREKKNITVYFKLRQRAAYTNLEAQRSPQLKGLHCETVAKRRRKLSRVL